LLHLASDSQVPGAVAPGCRSQNTAPGPAADNPVYVLIPGEASFEITWLEFQRKQAKDEDVNAPACPTDFPEEQPSDYEIQCWINAGRPIVVRVTAGTGGLTFDPGVPDEWNKRFAGRHDAEWRPEAFEEYSGLGMYKFELDRSKWEHLEGELFARYKAEGVQRALAAEEGRRAVFTETTTLELRHKPRPFRK